MHAVTDFMVVWLHRSKDFILNQTLSIRRLSVRVDSLSFCLANQTKAGLKVEELKPLVSLRRLTEGLRQVQVPERLF